MESIERYIRKPELLKIIPKCYQSICYDIAKGLLVKPVKIGARAVAWRESDVKTYQMRLEARNNTEPTQNLTETRMRKRVNQAA